MSKRADATYNIVITPQYQMWGTSWEEIPFGVTAFAVVTADGAPASGLEVKFTVPEGVGVWEGSEEASPEELIVETQYDGRAHAVIKFNKQAHNQLQPITVSVPEPGVTTPASDSKTVLFADPTLSAHTFPLAEEDGVITESDVSAGVFAMIPAENLKLGDVVGLYFDDQRIYHSVTEPNVNIYPVAIPDGFMTSGIHPTAHYIKSSSGNISFSEVIKVGVVRDSSTSTIKDLPDVRVPLADANNGTINIHDTEVGIQIIIDGKYPEGEDTTVVANAVEASTCNVYLKSYRDGKLVPEASRTFGIPVPGKESGQDTITLDDNYGNEGDALKSLFYALGEGVLHISYEMLMQSDNKLHASKEKVYFVDVIPPKRK